MKESEYRELKRQAKHDRIFIQAKKYSPLDPANAHVPQDHKDKFACIQSLGRTEYFNYGWRPNHESPDKPWEQENKRKALKLVHSAAKCRKENRNEAGWRNEVESRLFERFDIEVACKRCRRRLWRSEIEIKPSSSNSKTSSLKDRQRKREPCRCNPTSRQGDHLDSGMSDIFSSRLQEAVYQTGTADPNSFNPKKEPDRIHGLQRTKKFEKLLAEPYAHDVAAPSPPKLLEDVLKISMNPDNGGEPLLFPFLVLEAKSEKGSENFEHMEIQTAFPVRNALKLQYDLLKQPGNTMDVPGGPLAWFVATRGEDWRVYGAFVHEEEGRPNYWIHYLWGGSVTGMNEALQLVLIIDYILDWARDAYRPNIIRQLKTLTSSNPSDDMTVSMDPDVYSVRGEVQPWMQGHDIDPEEMLDPNASDAVSAIIDDEPVDDFGEFKCSQGVVRDARLIESRLRSLYLTRDNIQTLFDGIDNPNTKMRFARSILATLARRCVVLDNEDVLGAVEDKWTGNVRSRTRISLPGSKLYAQFRFSYFINHSWEQIRELTYLAVSDDAREILLEKAQFRSTVRRSRFSPPECSREEIIHTIEKFLARNVREDFDATLARSTYFTDMEKMPVTSAEGIGSAGEETLLKMVSKLDKDKKSAGVTMQNTVHSIYERFRVGNREPTEPFLRISSRLDYENRSLSQHNCQGDQLDADGTDLDKALVFGDVLKTRGAPQGSEQKLCLYILDGKKDVQPWDVIAKLLWLVCKGSIYGTVRKGKVYRTGKESQENRNRILFFMSEAQEHLKISTQELLALVFGWIKEVNHADGEPGIDDTKGDRRQVVGVES